MTGSISSHTQNFKIMKKLSLILITALTFLSAESSSAATEATYLETRNKFIHQFHNKESSTQEKAALTKLEKILREVIGTVKFSDKKGEITLETLNYNFDDIIEPSTLDGLFFRSDKETFFVTTKTLLDDYMSRHPNLPKEFDELHQNLPKNFDELVNEPKFYNKIFNGDAAFTKYAELPIKNNSLNTRAFLMLEAQDIGNFPPNLLMITAIKDGKIFVIKANLDEENQISFCANEWQKANDKKYTTSKNENIIFQNYVNCYKSRLENEKFLPQIMARAQAIISRI